MPSWVLHDLSRLRIPGNNWHRIFYRQDASKQCQDITGKHCKISELCKFSSSLQTAGSFLRYEICYSHFSAAGQEQEMQLCRHVPMHSEVCLLSSQRQIVQLTISGNRTWNICSSTLADSWTSRSAQNKCDTPHSNSYGIGMHLSRNFVNVYI